MAHLAKLDRNSKVISVIAIGDEYEENCEQFYHELTGDIWKRTSYNTRGNVHRNGGTPFRYNYATIGGTFDPTIGTDGAFIGTSPYFSWVLNTDTCLWEAPIPEPTDGDSYWNEATRSWGLYS